MLGLFIDHINTTKTVMIQKSIHGVEGGGGNIPPDRRKRSPDHFPATINPWMVSRGTVCVGASNLKATALATGGSVGKPPPFLRLEAKKC